MSRFEDPKFLALRKAWYEKLKADGFHDIEYIDWNTGKALGEPETGRCYLTGQPTAAARRAFAERQVPGGPKTSTPEYWRCAGLWAEREGFRGRRKQIWRLWADGLPIVAIAEHLALPRPTVSRAVRLEERLMLASLRDGTFDGKVGL